MTKQEQVLAGIHNAYHKMVCLNKRSMELALQGYTPSEVHCMEYIGKHTEANVTKLAQAFYMTRGAVSKLTKKLMHRNLIESYQKAENKKEVYFRLTAQGEQVFEVHASLHREFLARDQAVFDELKEAEFNILLRFLSSYNCHLDAEMQNPDAQTLSE